MYFEQFYLACLSHASYMIGSEGVAAVVDPQRDVEIYLEEARNHGLSIQHIIETHLHADFVSGHRELAAATGATIYIGRHAEAAFPHSDALDREEIRFGQCRLQFLETPGHSLDSISILVTDFERSRKPFAVLTGDTLFIGDVGRPDLSKGKSPQQMAELLYRSLQDKILRLSDDVQVYPAHGAGSLCGKQLSAERWSTIGKEKATNYALRPTNEADFVDLITSELPERPGYFAIDKEINRTGAPLLAELPPLPALRPQELIDRQNAGAVVLDTRRDESFAAAHIPRSLHIGLSGQFASWAGMIVGLDGSVILVAENDERLAESRLRLARVGIEKVLGYLDGGIAGWANAGLGTQHVRQITVGELHRVLAYSPDDFQVVDVRRRQEWDEGHIASALLIPLHNLKSNLDALESGRPVAVHCKSGYRSLIATSLLQSAGFQQVANVVGGFDAWRACNLPQESTARALAS